MSNNENISGIMGIIDPTSWEGVATNLITDEKRTADIVAVSYEPKEGAITVILKKPVQE